MREIYLLLLVFFAAGCSGNRSDLDRSGIKGKVHFVEEHTYKAQYIDGQWSTGEPGRFGHMKTEYDRDGNYVVGFALDERGNILGTTRCKRENGEMVEESFYAASGMQLGRTLYERISADEVQFEIWEGEKLRYEGANFYNRSGKLVRQHGFENNMEVINYLEYDGHLMVLSYQEDLTGRRLYTRHYEYTRFDEKGNWTLRLVYPGEDKIVPEVAVTREYIYF